MEAGEQQRQIYHERQRLQFCLLHALNNLLQVEDSFTRAEVDAIADKLILDDPDKPRWTPFSVVFGPHHNRLTGNYDVNVLIAALEGRGKRVIWHDRRNGASSIGLGRSNETLMGIMLNVPVKRFAGLWRSRHWISLRRIDGVWYNLDSDLDRPKSFKDEEEVIEFLDDIVSHGAEVFVVLSESSLFPDSSQAC
uniref:ubiquitinyl hydrolase 1 n=1 Tax=Anthurium amnicola TaxID=1678845 RepID=A0A1D1YP11_9ARAE